MRDLTFYLANTPPLLVDVDTEILYYRPIEGDSTPVCLHFSRPQATFSKHSMSFSFQCAVALTPLASTLVIDGELISCSVDAGFVLSLPLHHKDLELDSVGVTRKSYMKITLLLW